jgi:hypothetical protein
MASIFFKFDFQFIIFSLQFFVGKVFSDFKKWTKINVQNPETQNTLLKKQGIVTIIQFYGLVTKKIIFKTLA